MTLDEMHGMMAKNPAMGMRRASWPREEGTVFYYLDVEWRFEDRRSNRSGPAHKSGVCSPADFNRYDDWVPAPLGWAATQFRREDMKRKAARLADIRKARGEA